MMNKLSRLIDDTVASGARLPNGWSDSLTAHTSQGQPQYIAAGVHSTA